MKKNSHIIRALNNLKKSPLKVTIQRTRLIEILFKNGDHHFTAEDVHKEVNKNEYNIYPPHPRCLHRKRTRENLLYRESFFSKNQLCAFIIL